ncbi:MAG TPA: RNA polymerase sigma factor [Stellaceae bacterium]|nr:RNA polymerase sigma factor [Stellaceae bacterium]
MPILRRQGERTLSERQDIAAPIGEAELTARLRCGDHAAFAAVMRRNNQRLYRLARGILKDEGEAEEAVQEGYVRAFTHLDRFKGEASLSTWLARIVANEALGRLRRRRMHGVGAAEAAGDDRPCRPVGSNPNPEHLAARREIRRLIERAVDALPGPFRIVFVLRAVEQLSTKETAASLGIREETVKTRLHRANRLLRGALGAQFASIWDDAFPFAGRRCDGLSERVLARLGDPRRRGEATEGSR